ncbi:MAG: hypothetical protein CM15mP130_0520 [Verrucomicrobiota bacterium]|nr:MAG: hypothetical protein CM15mP130_0520 [Verrucomicrobiota bacterium]
MKVLRVCTLVTIALAFVAITETTYGWELLFDGKSTDNWTPLAEVEIFEAKGKELHLFSKRNVWVVSQQKMKNFEVECEVKIPLDYEGFNSGLGFRLSDGKGKPIGYQCEIDRFKPAGIYGIGMGGWLYPSKTNQQEYNRKIKNLFIAENWNHFRVICKGTKCITFLNGHKIAEINSVKEIVGHFGIQHHGKGGIVKFRNIKVKKIN